jgi:hypothetical protein
MDATDCLAKSRCHLVSAEAQPLSRIGLLHKQFEPTGREMFRSRSIGSARQTRTTLLIEASLAAVQS